MSRAENRQGKMTRERRQFFRIEDRVSLSYRPVSAADLERKLEQLERNPESEFTLMSSLAAISQETAGLLNRIETVAPDVARYLKAQDRKIHLLARAFQAQGSELSEQQARPVNLSASGMAFVAGEPLETGTLLELKLLLLPSFTGILTYAEVVGCERGTGPEGAQGWQVRVRFRHLREKDRDVLIRHVIQRQGALLRRRRQARLDDTGG